MVLSKPEISVEIENLYRNVHTSTKKLLLAKLDCRAECVMAEPLNDLSAMLKDLNRVSQEVGLKINIDNKKDMLNAHVVSTTHAHATSQSKLLKNMSTWT
ncbi:hypothetical protein EVAR_8190_1 [Eumeta japonica]|uniref:Uncharacterized protein n=1 Tax=Eumeta variegata TaxID=151549 RepID=A0A4C1TFI9_EUMVA|nr:hypothetical protein EVAR_8190_1 [Eumeta japonica]